MGAGSKPELTYIDVDRAAGDVADDHVECRGCVERHRQAHRTARPTQVRLELEDVATGTPFGQPVVSPVLDGGTFSGVTVPVPVATLPGTYLLAACQACGDVDFFLAADHQLTVLAPTLEDGDVAQVR